MTVKDVSERLVPGFVPLMVGALVVALAGCAGGAGEAEAPAAGEEVEAPAEADGGESESSEGDAEAGAGADLGTITVGTTSYRVIEAVNCEPVQSNELTTEVFNSIAFGQSAEGEDVLFFAYTQEQSGARANFIDYQGPEGTWSTQEGNATFTYDGGVLSGASALVNDDLSESIMIQFTFDLPEELVGC
ncbi:hypothetical protein [Microcella indica]|jgi:hypothetical protein|uniref:hypothetical protein n=1 Tax=Microcella indica TaxID=2750620 RepID=UPI0015CF7291|nr:hypothetical protein [Microcella indica]